MTRRRVIIAVAAIALLAAACGTSHPATPTTTTVAPGPQSGAVVGTSNVPPSINDTCAADDTKALARWLYGLVGGTDVQSDKVAPTTADLGTGCYLVNGSLFLRNFRHFVLEGGTIRETAPTIGDTFQPPSGDLAPYCGSGAYKNPLGTNFLAYSKTVVNPIFFEGGCDITVRDVRFEGPNGGGASGGEAQQDSFITFAGTQTALVDGLNVNGPLGDYVDVAALHEAPGPVEGSYEASNVTVEHSQFRNAGRQGIGVILANRITIVHDTFYSAAATVFDIEWDSTGGTQADIDIADNTIVGQHYAFLLAALTGAKVERLQFSGNGLVKGAQMRIVIRDGQVGNNVRIDDNVGQAVDTASDYRDAAVAITGVDASSIAVDHNQVPVGKAGLASVPKGSIVCSSSCPVIHIVGPTVAALP